MTGTPELPDVSVVIPTRNRWGHLTWSLYGALNQQNTRLEVIVVDDASDERPPAGCTLLTDLRVRLIRNQTRRGVAGARNVGIDEARGDWVAFLDDDDLWSPEKLAGQLGIAETTGANLVYSSAVLLGAGMDVLRLVPAPSPARLREGIRVQNIMPAGPSNVLVRRDLVRRLGNFDEHLSMLADWDLWIRLAAAAELAPCPDIHVGYVLHAGNMHVTDLGSDAEFDYVANAHMRDTLSRRKALIIGARWRAYNHRRSGRRRLAAAEYLRAAMEYRAPGMALRAAGALLGERVMTAGCPAPNISVPWLQPYAEGHRAADKVPAL